MDDLISRQAALDAIGEIHPLDYNAQAIAERIKELPSAQPERKKGKWLPYLPKGLRYKCSECGSRFETPWHFCPNCGSYNGGGDNETD